MRRATQLSRSLAQAAAQREGGSALRPLAAASLMAAGGAAYGWARPCGAEGSSYPELKRGPWCVSAARAVPIGKGIWAPSKDFKFVDSDSFFATRAKGHLRAGIGQRKRLGEQQGGQVKNLGYEAMHEPLERDGVEMLPVHAAAQDDNVWWLERCGAMASCRAVLVIGDVVEDAPLHHAARKGREAAVKALLRLSAAADAKNAKGELPEDVAAAAGHTSIAALLRTAREVSEPTSGESTSVTASASVGSMRALPEAAMRHADGLGVLAEPPEEIVHTGIQESEPLRSAVNMAAGYAITPPLPVTRSQQEGTPETADRITDVVRGGLQSSEFMLDEVKVKATEDIFIEERSGGEVLRCCGLVVYEAPGEVTPGAPGNWVAVRPAAAAGEFWRLDPVRGPYRMTAGELKQLVGRYRTWRLVRGPANLREQREAQLQKASQEAAALIRRRDGPAER